MRNSRYQSACPAVRDSKDSINYRRELEHAPVRKANEIARTSSAIVQEPIRVSIIPRPTQRSSPELEKDEGRNLRILVGGNFPRPSGETI